MYTYNLFSIKGHHFQIASRPSPPHIMTSMPLTGMFADIFHNLQVSNEILNNLQSNIKVTFRNWWTLLTLWLSHQMDNGVQLDQMAPGQAWLGCFKKRKLIFVCYSQIITVPWPLESNNFRYHWFHGNEGKNSCHYLLRTTDRIFS